MITFWVITMFVLGITVGSFLTAVIYRLNAANWPSPTKPLSLLEPQRSMCPNCKHALGPFDLMPLFSFLIFGQKCRYCKKPISWRYFGVELLTGLTFVAIYLKFPHDVSTLTAMLVFAAVLIPIFFIDFETFTIPISLTLLATVIAVTRDAWGIAHSEAGFELLWGWLPRSLMGWLIGTLIFGAVRIAGWLYKGVEAMGLGDVFLARAMGTMFMVVMPANLTPAHLAYWSFPLWVILSCVSGILVFPMFVVVRRQGQQKDSTKLNDLGNNSKKTRDKYGNLLTDVETTVGDPEEFVKTVFLGLAWGTEFAYQLMEVGQVLVCYDAYEWARFTFDRKYRAECAAKEAALPPEEVWIPDPTAIPFGPFLVVGFLLTLFFGKAIIIAYLAYAHL